MKIKILKSIDDMGSEVLDTGTSICRMGRKTADHSEALMDMEHEFELATQQLEFNDKMKGLREKYDLPSEEVTAK